jgi:hypothetical protein
MSYKTIFLGVLLVTMRAGCMSLKAKRQMYIDIKNDEIGLPFYVFDKDGTLEIKISESDFEFIQDPIPENGCGIAWIVDTSERGSYQHPTNGLIFQIEGFKKSWRFIGNPDHCMGEINWLGPF